MAIATAVTAPHARSIPVGASGPLEVLIIRNAEEPKGADVHLNDAGKARAKALVQWIPATYGKLDALIASHATPKSKRAAETLEPMATALHLKVQDQFATEDYKKLADKLLKDSEFAGKRILVCWNKGDIAKLAKALGAKDAPAWPDGQYDHIWRLKFDAGKVTLEDAAQKLPSRGK